MANMVEFESGKFYYGSTIYLIGYKHEEYGYKFTTMSSSYTIDDMVMCGVNRYGDAYKQIQKYQNFTINILALDNYDFIEYGMKDSGDDRFKINSDKISYTIDEEYDVPLINDVAVCLICSKVNDFIMETNDDIVNVGAKIQKRLIDEKYIEDGEIKVDKLKTILYFSTSTTKEFRKV